MTIGLPRMHKEAGERRDFLPGFVRRLAAHGFHVVLEMEYGTGMGISSDRYRSGDRIRFGTIQECYASDIVLVLRYPDEALIQTMRPGTCLVSMVHMETRPSRVQFFRRIGVDAVSLESVTDDTGRRLVENLRSVGWNGMEAAFDLLERTWTDFANPDRGPLRVLLIGAGAVGAHAMAAAINYGRRDRRASLIAAGVPGVLVSVIDNDLTASPGLLESLLRESVIVVDATRRPRSEMIVVRNDQLALLPDHAVLVDLSVDPYVCDSSPIAVKAIEGMPQGDLDSYAFLPDDPAWDRVPDCVSTNHRRSAVSCYSWPAIHPEECMEIYGKQVFPLLRTIHDTGGTDGIRSDGTYFHRALSRSLVSRFQDGF